MNNSVNEKESKRSLLKVPLKSQGTLDPAEIPLF